MFMARRVVGGRNNRTSTGSRAVGSTSTRSRRGENPNGRTITDCVPNWADNPNRPDEFGERKTVSAVHLETRIRNSMTSESTTVPEGRAGSD